MKILTTIIRLLLGLAFVVFGANVFFHYLPMPAEWPKNPAGNFMNALFVSNYVFAIGLCQIAGGLLLLIGRYVALGLTILGPIVVNILLYHLFLDPSGLIVAFVVLALWLFLVWRWWGAFAGLFRRS